MNFVVHEIFLQFHKIIFTFEKFEENFAKHEYKNFIKISRNYKNEVLQQPYAGVKWRGEAGQYSPGASSALTQIVPYSASLYTVFHSVIYNSVVHPLLASHTLCEKYEKILTLAAISPLGPDPFANFNKFFSINPDIQLAFSMYKENVFLVNLHF